MSETGQREPTEPRRADANVERHGSSNSEIDPGRLWIGAILAAVVAGLLAAVCLLVSRGIFGVTIFLKQGDAALIEATMGTFALVAAGAALLATGLMHVLIVIAPEPDRFFTWITGLLVTVAVLTPFATGLTLTQQIASASSNLVIGVAIVALVRFVTTSATRPR